MDAFFRYTRWLRHPLLFVALAALSLIMAMRIIEQEGTMAFVGPIIFLLLAIIYAVLAMRALR